MEWNLARCNMAGKGQPRKTRNEETARQVLKMAQLGVPHERIARKVALSTVVLRRLYAEELEQGNIDAEIALSNTAFRLATDPQNPDKAMIMFLLKTRFGYRETERKEINAEVKNTTPIQLIIKDDLKDS